MKRILALLLSLLLVLSLAACGQNGGEAGNSGGQNDSQNNSQNDGQDSGGQAPDDEGGAAAGDDAGTEDGGDDLAGVTLNYDAYTLTAFGETFRLYPEGIKGVYAATYASADEDVAMVDLNGNVTATGVGTTTVTLHIEQGGQKDLVCTVTCDWTDDLPRLNRTDFTLKNAGDSFRLQVLHLPEGAEVGTWTISDETVATIAEDGTVTAVAGGRATASIEVELGGETLTLSCIVRCSAPAESEEESGAEEGSGEDTASQSVDLAAFYTSISEKYAMPMGLGQMTSDELVENYFPGLTAISTKQRVIYYTMMTMNNGELAMVEVENASDVDTVKAIFQTRVDTMVNGGAWYPSATEIWTNSSRIVSYGNYVLMVVGEDCDAILADFEALLP